MKKFILYAVAILGSIGLIYGEEMSGTDDTDWVFAVSTLLLFALFLQGWKRWNPGGGGIIAVTAFMLFTIGSIFLLDEASVLIYSFLLGLLLLPFCRRYRDAAVTSLAFVMVQLVLYTGIGNDIMVWLLFTMNGLFALGGAYLGLKWLRRCFTVLFSMSALLLVFINSFNEGKLILILVVAAIVLVSVGIYKFSRPVAALKE